MCGIAGIWPLAGRLGPEAARDAVGAMTAVLGHRGPDAGGLWADAAADVVLGHRRLSIVELSPQGAQPMQSHCGRYVISYNGEVYNHAALRVELEKSGAAFRGRSDTEVILEACTRWGVVGACRRFIGMFAFALWDSVARELWLVRDRLGIKPLYWGWVERDLVWASELKAFAQHPGWSPEIDPEALGGYLRTLYVAAPRTIYRGVRKLEPGTILRVRSGGECESERFWDFGAIASEGQRDLLQVADGEAVERLDALLRDAVGLRMIADVPLGALLSGGIDSSVVTALMQAQSDRPVKTFSIGFQEDAYNEAPFARSIAEHLGTDHTELYVTSGDALNVVPKLADFYDEPFADSSQIPTYLVSALARRHVTVALSGDGGDEVFMGYRRYFETDRRWDRLQKLPAAARTPLAGAAGLCAGLAPGDAGRRLEALRDMLSSDDSVAFYSRVVSAWPSTGSPLADSGVHAGLFDGRVIPPGVDQILERMQYLDTLTYLPDDILAKVDRASMAVALEARVPLLDHRVVEFAWRLPRRFKYRDGQTKWLLRRVLDRYVPARLIDRPKMGFGLPVGPWLRGPLREWSEELLSPAALSRSGLLRIAPIRRRWDEHRSGRVDWSASLWAVLMFQLWYDRWMVGAGKTTSVRHAVPARDPRLAGATAG